MNSDWDTRKPIETFFRRLAILDAVMVELREYFGERTPSIIKKLKKGQPLLGDELAAHDLITDLVNNESKAVKTLHRRNQKENEENEENEDEYVNLMRFGSGRRYVYWIDHVDFPAGYFGSMKAAKDYADIMYVP